MTIIDRKTGAIICESEVGPLSSDGHKTYRLHGSTHSVQLTAREADHLQSLRRQAVTK